MKTAILVPRISSRKVLDLLVVVDQPVFYLEKSNWFWRAISRGRARQIDDISVLYKDLGFKTVVVIPLEEFDLKFLADLVLCIPPEKCHIIWHGPTKNMTVLSNKKEFQNFCEARNLPIASSQLNGKKFVVKPIFGSGSRGVKFCGWTEAEAKVDDAGYVVQQFIESDDSPYGFSGFSHQGSIEFLIGHQRIITSGGAVGSSILARQIDVPEAVSDVCVRLIRELEFSGFFMVEMIKSKCGDWIIIELNPRIWGSFRLGIRFIDFSMALPKFELFETKRSLFFLHGFLVRPCKLIAGVICEFRFNRVRMSPSCKLLWKR